MVSNGRCLQSPFPETGLKHNEFNGGIGKKYFFTSGE